MPLIINNEKINDTLIIEEVQKLRQEQRKTGKNQCGEAEDGHLLEQAKERVVQTVLIQQHAKNDPRKISGKRIDSAFRLLIKQCGGEPRV